MAAEECELVRAGFGGRTMDAGYRCTLTMALWWAVDMGIDRRILIFEAWHCGLALEFVVAYARCIQLTPPFSLRL